MHRLLVLLRAGLILSVLILVARSASALDFLVFPMKVSLPIHTVLSGPETDRIVKRTLKEKDVVNLALGRPLGTKVDKETEILAVAYARFSPDLLSTVVVFDPSQNGVAQVTTTVAVATSSQSEGALLAKGKEGLVTGTGEVQETTLGDPMQNALHASVLFGGGSGKASDDDKVSGKGLVAGRMSVTVTENGQTTTFGGFVVKGKAKVSGKPIGMFSDGVFVGCGDGIVQPGLGEECEFNDQTACPGQCSACICHVCGNNRVDAGEICDGTDNAICDAQTTPVPCREDCSGCAVCGDGIISPHEECDTSNQAPCPGLCLFPECQCGCDASDPQACPGHLCCGLNRRCWAVKTGFPSDDPNSTVSGGQSCNGGGVQPGGLCDGVVAPGELCPDQDADNDTLFICHPCNGKGVHNICTIGAQSCVLDQIGPVP